ncbi:MAG: ABC transporter ATP-binding protein [Bacteriovoracaceae bacterium]
MTSTSASEVLMSVKDIKIFFELEHYHHKGVRDVFTSALAHPFEYLMRQPEILSVVDGVSFDITRGMRLGIIGTNGSGKTTLCRALAGMILPQVGSITSNLEVRAIFDTGTGVVSELTGRENAYLLARLFFPQLKDLRPIVEEAIEFSELGHFIDIPFNNYSKGMQSRILLSLISSVPSEILILDEVFDAADIFFQKKFASRMRKFIQSAGATVFVSHSIDQIRQVCNHLIVLHKGKIHFQGDIEEGYQAYLKIHQMNESAERSPFGPGR